MKIKILTTLMTTAAVLLTACSSDETGHSQGRTEAPAGEPLQLVSVTRGSATDAVLGDIKVLMTPDVKPGTYYEGSYVKTETGWQHLVSVNAEKYHIYGYMPGNHVSASISMLCDDYKTGAVLTFSDLPAATPHDVCLVTSVKKDVDDAFVQGNYALDNTDNANTVSLHLDHLMASVAFKVAIGSSRNYSDLRSIKLKTLSLQTTKLTKTLVTFRQGSALTDDDIVFTLDATKKQECPIYTDGEWLKVPTDTIRATGYFVPALSNALELVAEYDVYDKQDHLVRSGCKAVSKLPMNALSRGQQFMLKLTIEPTYLYQLSDTDLDNPTIMIRE